MAKIKTAKQLTEAHPDLVAEIVAAAKQAEVEIITVDQLTEAYPDLVAEIVAAAKQAEVEIITVDQLTEAYPDLVTVIVKTAGQNAATETAKAIAALTPAQFKKEFEQLHTKVAAVAAGGNVRNLNTPGFLLEVDDPFAEGVARFYAARTGNDNVRLPIVLPDKDPATIAALANYIVRANGSGDKKRADAAAAKLAKLDKKKK